MAPRDANTKRRLIDFKPKDLENIQYIRETLSIPFDSVVIHLALAELALRLRHGVPLFNHVQSDDHSTPPPPELSHE